MIKADNKKEIVTIKGTPLDIINEIANVCYALLDDAAEHGEKLYLDIQHDLLENIALVTTKIEKEKGFDIDYGKIIEKEQEKIAIHQGLEDVIEKLTKFIEEDD